MGRKVKDSAFAEEGSAIGHNNPINAKNLQEHVIYVAKKEAEKRKIDGQIKDRLGNAKNEGFLKTSIRKAVKILNMSEEQIQAKKEIDDATEYYTDLCRDLPLFAAHSEEEAA